VIDSSRAVCGIATCFGGPGRANWQPEAFEAWLGLGLGFDMRIDHGPLLTPQGFIATIGTAAVPAGDLAGERGAGPGRTSWGKVAF
jgi:hypothetical protein